MQVSWDNSIYAFANQMVAISLKQWEEGNEQAFWKYSLVGRVAYLGDTILNLFVLPYAFCETCFSALRALFFWNRSLLTPSMNNLKEKNNHFTLSLFGALVSPSLAYKHRDLDLTPFFIIARVISLLYLLIPPVYFACH